MAQAGASDFMQASSMQGADLDDAKEVTEVTDDALGI